MIVTWSGTINVDRYTKNTLSLPLNFNLANAYAAIADVNTVSAVVASPTKIELNIYLANQILRTIWKQHRILWKHRQKLLKHRK